MVNTQLIAHLTKKSPSTIMLGFNDRRAIVQNTDNHQVPKKKGDNYAAIEKDGEGPENG